MVHSFQPCLMTRVRHEFSGWLWVQGRLALLAVFLFWIPIVVAISGWTTLSSIQGTVPAVKKFVEAHPTIGSCLAMGPGLGGVRLESAKLDRPYTW